MPVESAEVTIGRTFALSFQDGDDLLPNLIKFCEKKEVVQGYIPLFLGAFRKATVVGASEPHEGEIPMLDAAIDLQYVETIGAGTIATDDSTGSLSPHIHLSLGQRLSEANGLTSHLFNAEVQFLVEMVLVEIQSPKLYRVVDETLFDLKLLKFQ